MPVPESLPFHVCLAGPTASGKSALALALAQHYPLEIISVDSALVYRGMDVGTAKPSLAERAQVQHHLIDIRDPLQAYSAAEFMRDAHALIHAINARGRLPLLVGGTMLYFRALALGLDAMPAADAAVRAAIEAEAALHGWPAMHAVLARSDPITAQRLAPGDSQRIARALEVLRVSGLPLSHFHTQHARAQGSQRAMGLDGKTTEPANASTGGATLGVTRGLLLSLECQDRDWLHARIAQRFDTMLDAGLLDEVAALRARGDLHADLPSMRCVGYRQSWQALSGAWPMAELRTRGVSATRQLAKRQMTWLRSMPGRHPLDCTLPGVLDQARRLIDAARAGRELAP